MIGPIIPSRDSTCQVNWYDNLSLRKDGFGGRLAYEFFGETMKHLRPIALILILLFVGLPQERAAAAEESDWRIELRPGYTWLSRDDESMQGFSVGVMGAWRAFDNVFLKLDLDNMFLDINDPGRAYAINPALGINYDFDLAPLLPTIGTGLGPLFTQKEDSAWSIDLSWHLLLSLQYFIRDDVGFGLEGKYFFILTDMNQNPIYATASAKVTLAF